MGHSSLPGSFDLERFQAVCHSIVHVALVHSIYPAAARSPFQHCAKFREFFFAAGNHDLDLTSVCIANPTLQSANPCFAMDQPTESDPLNAALHNVVAHHKHLSPVLLVSRLETGKRLRRYPHESFLPR